MSKANKNYNEYGPFPDAKMWEMYDVLTANCNDCSSFKDDTRNDITKIKIFVGVCTALSGIFIIVLGLFQGSLNFLVH